MIGERVRRFISKRRPSLAGGLFAVSVVLAPGQVPAAPAVAPFAAPGVAPAVAPGTDEAAAATTGSPPAPTPVDKQALLQKAIPAARALCAHLEGDALEWCVQGCTWPPETACLMVRRWGPLGINVAVMARNQKRDVREVAKEAGQSAEWGRLLRLYADHEQVARVDWNPAVALNDAGKAAMAAAQQATIEGVQAFRARDLDRAAQRLGAALEAVRQVLGKDHVEAAHAQVRLGHVRLAQRRLDAASEAFLGARAIFAAVMETDHPAIADVEVMIAQAAVELQQPARARPLIEGAIAKRAKTHGDDDPLVATSWNHLANACSELADYACQGRALERSLAIRQVVSGPDSEQTATELSNLGLYLTEQGRFHEGRAMLERSLALRRLPGRHPRDLAYSLNNLAGLEKSLGNLKVARSLLEDAIAAWERDPRHDPFEKAVSQQMLGQILFDSGDIQAGITLMVRVDELRQRLPANHPQRILSMRNLGQYQLAAAAMLPRGADRTTYEKQARERIEAAFRATLALRGAEHPETGEMLLVRAGMLQQVEGPGAALPVYEAALAVLRRHHPEGHRLCLVALANLAGAALADGKAKLALPHYQKAQQLALDSLGAWHPTTRGIRSQLLLTRLELGFDSALLDDAGTLVAGLLDRMSAAIPAAATDIELLVLTHQLGHERGTILRLVGTKADPARVFEWAMQLTGAAQRVETVWRVLRRAGAAGGEAGNARTTALAAALEARRELSREQLALEAAAGGVRLTPEQRVVERRRVAAAISAADGRLLKLAPELADLQRALRPSLAAVCATLAKQQAALVAYVEPHLADASKAQRGHYAAFVVDARCQVSAHVLGGSREVDALIAAYRKALAETTSCFAKRRKMQLCAAAAKQQDEAGAAVRAAVWQPLQARIGGLKRVWIAPTEDLNAISFDALPDAAGRYLVHDLSVGYVTHPGALAPMVAARPAGRGALVVGDVDYDAAASSAESAVAAWRLCGGDKCGDLPAQDRSKRVAAAVRSATRAAPMVCGQDAHWAALPQTEADAVARALGRRLGEALLVSGPSATEAALTDAFEGRRVIHLASHGYFAPAAACVSTEISEAGRAEMLRMGVDQIRADPVFDPLRQSALVVSGRNRRVQGGASDVGIADDGLLTARDLARLDLRAADLVVLSACETGLGENANADGPVGLGRALLVAGVGSVVASLWQVPSIETSALFAAFYERIQSAEGGAPAKASKAGARTSVSSPLPSTAVVDAMRAARLQLIVDLERRGVTRSAFLWGAFVPIAGRP